MDVSSRELVILGTASQAPTRSRSQNSCFLRWDNYGFLFDPGEGTQRQLLMAGIPSSAITHICVTHLHGDHCLGLPGVLQRLSLDDVRHPITLAFPASGMEYIERLRRATIYDDRTTVELAPVSRDGVVATVEGLTVSSARLDHRVDAYGWRLDEPDGRRMLPDRLAALGIAGPAIGQLQHDGSLVIDGRTITVEEVSEHRQGQSFAFIMDTRVCDGAKGLAQHADLLVTEATYLSSEESLATEYGHMTAAQSAELAKAAGARRLVLTHFSARYPDVSVLGEEASKIFPDVVVAQDLMKVEVPARH